MYFIQKKVENESIHHTIEVLSDADLMTQIEEGKRKNAPTRDFGSLQKSQASKIHLCV